MKFSNWGAIEWQKTYNFQLDSLLKETVYSIQPSSDGGYIVAGYETSSPGQMGALILKLFPDGQIEWQKSFKRDVSICASSICLTSDGGTAVAGSGFNGDEGTDIWYSKLTPDGDMEWTKTFDREKKGAAYSIQPADEGGYLVYAEIEGQYWWTDHFIKVDSPLLLKLDSNGEIDADCVFIQDADVSEITTDIVSQDIFIGNRQPRYTGLNVKENDIEQRTQTGEFTLLCGEADLNLHYPPLNFYGEKVFTRSLSQAEYINMLSWETNPQNGQILKHRIYLLHKDSRILIAEVDAGISLYWHRKVKKDEELSYHIVSVDVQNRESYPATISVK